VAQSVVLAAVRLLFQVADVFESSAPAVRLSPRPESGVPGPGPWPRSRRTDIPYGADDGGTVRTVGSNVTVARLVA